MSKLPTTIAVYGTLRCDIEGVGMGNIYRNAISTKGKRVGNGLAKGEMYSLGAFPAVIHSDSDNEVVVEVWDLGTNFEAVMSLLDAYEGPMYDAFVTDVVLDDTGETVECYMYYWLEEDSLRSSNIVHSGDWETVVRSRAA